MTVSLKGAHFPKDVILTCVRWYVAYLLSYRLVEALRQERGVNVDHATVHWWVVKYSPHLEEASHRRKRPVWLSWRMDETSVKAAFLLTQETRRASGQAVLDQGDPPAWRAGEHHERWE
jgi:transposase-like protein